jgi:hypothetical protein
MDAYHKRTLLVTLRWAEKFWQVFWTTGAVLVLRAAPDDPSCPALASAVLTERAAAGRGAGAVTRPARSRAAGGTPSPRSR